MQSWTAAKLRLQESGEEALLSPSKEDAIRFWMIQGYLDAQKRFRGVSQQSLVRALCEVERRCDDFLAEVRYGDLLAISVIKKHGELKVKMELTQVV